VTVDPREIGELETKQVCFSVIAYSIIPT